MGRVYGEDRVEQVGEPDPVRLGDQPKQAAVTIEALQPAGLCELQPRLIIAVQDLL